MVLYVDDFKTSFNEVNGGILQAKTKVIMDWTAEAEDKIKKVPFFVRKKVRKRVEDEARAEGKKTITINEVKLTQKRFLTNMSKEVKGYQLDACFSGCPNSVIDKDRIAGKIEEILKKEDILSFLKKSVKGDLKFHHEFRITIAGCPNSCSQPQIKDIGIIGALVPTVSGDTCSRCLMCIDACREKAIHLDENGPVIDFEKCLYCGDCTKECPTGTIIEGKRGFRVQLGGKLGRHPRLAKELDGVFSEEELIGIVEKSIKFYKRYSKNGKRFGELFNDRDVTEIFE